MTSHHLLGGINQYYRFYSSCSRTKLGIDGVWIHLQPLNSEPHALPLDQCPPINESAGINNSDRAASWENQTFSYAKTKAQISFAVTAKLISAFVFATLIVQSLFLNPKFKASSLLLVCVRPGRKPRRQVFSWRGSYIPRAWVDNKIL